MKTEKEILSEHLTQGEMKHPIGNELPMIYYAMREFATQFQSQPSISAEDRVVKVVKGKHLKYGDTISCTIDDEGEVMGWYTLDPNIDDITELNELEADRNFLLCISSKLPSPDILIPSEADIEEWVKEHGYCGICTSDLHEGLTEGANWALSRLKELNKHLNFKIK